jgi:hypothetical protein
MVSKGSLNVNYELERLWKVASWNLVEVTDESQESPQLCWPPCGPTIRAGISGIRSGNINYYMRR